MPHLRRPGPLSPRSPSVLTYCAHTVLQYGNTEGNRPEDETPEEPIMDITAKFLDIPTISRAEHYARVESGEKATGRYAFIVMGMDGLRYLWDVRDEDDQQIDFGRASGPTMAQIAAKGRGATFFVSEF